MFYTNFAEDVDYFRDSFNRNTDVTYLSLVLIKKNSQISKAFLKSLLMRVTIACKAFQQKKINFNLILEKSTSHQNRSNIFGRLDFIIKQKSKKFLVYKQSEFIEYKYVIYKNVILV